MAKKLKKGKRIPAKKQGTVNWRYNDPDMVPPLATQVKGAVNRTMSRPRRRPARPKMTAQVAANVRGKIRKPAIKKRSAPTYNKMR